MRRPECAHCGCTCRSPSRWHDVRVELLLLAHDMQRVLGELHLLPPRKIHPESVATMRKTFNKARELIESARAMADRLPPRVR